MQEHMTPAKLERYAFYWLMALLVLSAVAMMLGARPLVLVVFGYSSSAIYSLLDFSWIVCGVAAGYLAYQFVKHDKQVFGGDGKKDLAAFWFMLLCGFNLGITGLLNTNVALSVSMSRLYLLILAALCLVSAYHLWNRWKGSGETLFPNQATGLDAAVTDAKVVSETPAESKQSTQHSDIKKSV